MEIHLKIKKSKKELEALENQEKEVRSVSLNSDVLISEPQPHASRHKVITGRNVWMKGRMAAKYCRYLILGLLRLLCLRRCDLISSHSWMPEARLASPRTRRRGSIRINTRIRGPVDPGYNLLLLITKNTKNALILFIYPSLFKRKGEKKSHMVHTNLLDEWPLPLFMSTLAGTPTKAVRGLALALNPWRWVGT